MCAGVAQERRGTISKDRTKFKGSVRVFGVFCTDCYEEQHALPLLNIAPKVSRKKAVLYQQN